MPLNGKEFASFRGSADSSFRGVDDANRREYGVLPSSLPNSANQEYASYHKRNDRFYMQIYGHCLQTV
jgi:hypothetical protein